MFSSHLAELLQLLIGVWVQFLGHVLHPQQGSSVLGARLLHPADRQQRVGDGAPPERLHLLVQAVQWGAHRHPVEGDSVRQIWVQRHDFFRLKQKQHSRSSQMLLVVSAADLCLAEVHRALLVAPIILPAFERSCSAWKRRNRPSSFSS